jgi:AcrR family transcriptional regulator
MRTVETALSKGSSPPGERSGPPQEILAPSERDRILQAMTECCAERGYRETRIEDVLERANVRRESFDAIFADKEDCAVAALHLITSEMVASLSMTGAAAARSASEAAAGIRAILEMMSERPARARLAYIQGRQGGTERMQEAYSSAALVLAPMIERARNFKGADGEAPPNAARAALGGAEAVVRREISAGESDLRRLAGAFLYAALVPFIGQAEALRLARSAGASPESGA